jgi:hypothetical protein
VKKKVETTIYTEQHQDDPAGEKKKKKKKKGKKGIKNLN